MTLLKHEILPSPLLMILLLAGRSSEGEVSLVPAKPVKALVRAHAHNDYRHRRPLLDALDHGFMSVKADVPICEVPTKVPGEANGQDKSGEASINADEARAIASEVLKQYPGDSKAIMVLANVEHRAGAVNRALSLFRGVVHLDPENSQARECIGDILTQKGLPQEALQEYGTACSGPGTDEDRARRFLKQALSLITLGRSNEAERVLREALKAYPEDSTLHYQLGQVLLGRGESVEALKELKEARRLGEDAGAVEYAISRAHFLSGNRKAGEEALKRYQAAKEKDPTPRLEKYRKKRDETWDFVGKRNVALAHLEAAAVHRSHGDFQKARAQLELALRRDSTLTAARYLLVRLLDEMGNLSEALEEMERLLREALDPEPLKKPAAALYLQSARRILSHPAATKKSLSEARKQAYRALELNKTAEAHEVAAWANLALGDRTPGLEHLWEAVRLDPENPERRRKLEALERRFRDAGEKLPGEGERLKR